MPFLPIAERELRVAARKKATYRTRFWAVLLVSVIFTWQFLSLASGGLPPLMHGKFIFIMLSVVAFVYCLLIGARVTADCLSEEKREGTLGLLFLTDLKGYDIVFGKLVSSSLNAVYGLLAIFPVIGICLLLGGVSIEQFAKTVLSLLTTLFFSLAAGLFVSTFNRQERVAMFFTIIVILLFAAGPVLLVDRELWPVWLLSPGFAFILAIEPSAGVTGMFDPNAYWYGLMVTWMTTASFLCHASSKLPRSWQDKQPKPLPVELETVEETQVDKLVAKAFRVNSLESNPYLWLVLRGRKKLNHAWGFIFAIVGIWFLSFLGAGRIMFDHGLLVPILIFVHGFLKIWVASEACTRLVQDRRSGALELLLSTPLSVREIIRGQHLALHRQFTRPFALFLFMEMCLNVASLASHHESAWVESFIPVAIVLFVADVFTLRWVAMWIGLNARSVNRALIKTGMLVLALPWIIYLTITNLLLPILRSQRAGAFTNRELFEVLCLVGIALLTDLILFLWAKSKLLNQFRSLATQPT